MNSKRGNRLGMGKRLLSALVVLAAVAGGAIAKTPARADVRTAHYDLHVEGIDAVDTGKLLEALHARLTRHFGKAPAGRLRVAVFATRRRFEAALRADRQFVPKSGGYYAPGNRKVYLWLQPSEYFTRHLILHEATHQFHWLAATANKGPAKGWYTEGLAEYFAMHNWDGNRLQTGIVPAITLEDYPERAIKQFDAAKRDLAGIVAGTTPCPRPVAWALTSFLINRHKVKFRKLAAMLDKRNKLGRAWRRTFGKVGPRFVDQFRKWLATRTQPWKIVWIAWQQRGDAIEGRSRTNAIAVLKQTPRKLEVRIETVGPAAKAGLVFGYKSTKDFYLFQVIGGKRFRVVRMVAGKWPWIKRGPLPPGKGPPVLAVVRGGGAVALIANGTPVHTVRVAGQVGLNVDATTARFTVAEPRRQKK